MIACEQEFLKAHERLEQLVEHVKQAGEKQNRIDEVERTVLAELLAMGFDLLQAFVSAAGDGDVGRTLEIPAASDEATSDCPSNPSKERTSATRRLKRLPEPHDRRYVSIFGELKITRWVYGTREGRKIEAIPLDARLGLPEGDFSYVLEDWQQRLCVKEAFGEATGDLKELLGVAPSVRAAEAMNREMSGFAPPFRDAQPLPRPEEEGELTVFTADGKGVPMRRPPEEKPPPGKRRTKGQKSNKKQMAYVGAVYTIDRFERTADDVVDELLRERTAADRPQPQHKHVAAEMTQVFEGQRCNGRVALFGQLSEEVRARNPKSNKPVVAVMDGEKALWEVLDFFLPSAVGILDIFHVMERLWQAAHIFHPEGSHAAETFVTDRLRRLLEGRLGGVIGGLRQMRSRRNLKETQHQTLEKVIGYFENNRPHMKYDEYLAAGYPIGSGVAEGACRHLVKDRLEQTGMRWSKEGAQSMLHLRSLYLNGQWSDFVEHRIKREQEQLYPYKNQLAP